MAVSIFKKAPQEQAKKVGRIQKLSYSELAQWADTTIMQLAHAFDQWRHHDHPIQDVSLYTDVLKQIIEELESRVASEGWCVYHVIMRLMKLIVEEQDIPVVGRLADQLNAHFRTIGYSDPVVTKVDGCYEIDLDAFSEFVYALPTLPTSEYEQLTLF
jgi:hypothetical protein